MAAVVRGGPASRARPRAASPKTASKPRAAPRPRAVYTPGKLGAAGHVGLPPKVAMSVAGVVVAGALAVALTTGDRPQRIAGVVSGGVAERFAAVGFKVRNLTVRGATPLSEPDIVRAAGVYRDQPILGLDLQAVRQRVQQVSWVKQARVERLLPDSVVISVVEHPALAVWQHQGQTQVIDNDGQVITDADPGRFPQLPLIVGEDAAGSAAEILPMVQSRPRLMQRLEALVRVDDRRWDLRMKDGGLIQLPETGEDAALIQLDQLDQKARILDLGFARVDLRDPDMVTVRPKDAAQAAQPAAGGA